MANPKQTIPDEKIKCLIKKGYTDYQITKEFGKNPGCMYGQIKRLRAELGIPSPGQRGKPNTFGKRQLSIDPRKDDVVTYTMSPEEIEERYGAPGLRATQKNDGEHQADQFLKEQAIRRKDAKQ